MTRPIPVTGAAGRVGGFRRDELVIEIVAAKA